MCLDGPAGSIPTPPIPILHSEILVEFVASGPVKHPGAHCFHSHPKASQRTAKYRAILSIAAFAGPVPTQGCQPPVFAPWAYESAMIRPPPRMNFAAVVHQVLRNYRIGHIPLDKNTDAPCASIKDNVVSAADLLVRY